MTPDEETRLWQRLISAETAIEELNKRLSEDSALWDNQARLLKSVAELDLRVKVIEEARQRQIAFNTEVSSKLHNLEKDKLEIKRSFWDLFKK